MSDETPPVALCGCGQNGDRCIYCALPMCCWIPLADGCDCRDHCEDCKGDCAPCRSRMRDDRRRP